MKNFNPMEFEIRKLTKEENKSIGVFISYARINEGVCKEIIEYFGEDVNVLSDQLLNADTTDFYDHINSMLVQATCGIVISSKVTPWMTFEIGRLKAMGKPIFVYGEATHPSLVGLPAITNLEELKEQCRTKVLFSDLFKEETATLKISDFNEHVLPNIGYVKLNIDVPGINKFPSSAYSFGYIIPQLLRKTPAEDDICYKNGEEFEDCMCKAYNANGYCPFVKRCKPNAGTIIINKIYNAISVLNNQVSYLIPVHKQNGTTFKCFIDIKDFTVKEELSKILQHAGVLKLDASGSGVQDRIYFTVPKHPSRGLFKIKETEGFENNYICPGALQ